MKSFKDIFAILCDGYFKDYKEIVNIAVETSCLSTDLMFIFRHKDKSVITVQLPESAFLLGIDTYYRDVMHKLIDLWHNRRYGCSVAEMKERVAVGFKWFAQVLAGIEAARQDDSVARYTMLEWS